MKQEQGIDVRKLKQGTILEIKTANNIYKIKILDHAGNVLIAKSKLGHNIQALFSGSTWGGTLMKIGWIGFGMQMEFHSKKKRLTTSPVQTAKVIGEGWTYDLEWQ